MPRCICCLLFFCFSLWPGFDVSAAAPTTHKGIFLSPARMATLRARVAHKTEPTYSAFQKLLADARAQLTRQPSPPKHWYVPGYYTDPQGHARAKQSLAEDANAAYTLALAYRMTGRADYAKAAIRLIEGWSTGVQTLSKENDSMLSFSYHFPAFIFAADLLRDAPGWSHDGQKTFQEFVRTKALPMNTMKRENNWGNWGLVLVLASAVYLDDHALLQQGVERWKFFLDPQIATDGHLNYEVTRNNGKGDYGIWYSHFSLMPQTIAAEILRVQRIDLFNYRSPKGRTLQQAYQTLVPWACHPESFPYFKGEDKNELKFTDYVAYWEILNAHWPVKAASEFLASHRPLTAKHCTPHLTFTHGDLLKDRE